jgi:hypothetical protein
MNIYKFSTEVFNERKSNTKLVSTEEISLSEVLGKCYDPMTMRLDQVFTEMGVTNVLSGTINRDTDTLHMKGYVYAENPETAEIILRCWEVSKNETSLLIKDFEEKLEAQNFEFNAAFSQAKEEWRKEKIKLEQELEQLLDRLEKIGV